MPEPTADSSLGTCFVNARPHVLGHTCVDWLPAVPAPLAPTPAETRPSVGATDLGWTGEGPSLPTLRSLYGKYPGLTRHRDCDCDHAAPSTDETVRLLSTVVNALSAWREAVAVALGLDGEDADDAEMEIAALTEDAARYRWLRDTFHAAKGGAHLEVNNVLAYYEKPSPGEEVQLQWYPDTPIGCYIVQGATLDEAIDKVRDTPIGSYDKTTPDEEPS
jgi:hypothetical protein